MCPKVTENYLKTINAYNNSRGSHLINVVGFTIKWKYEKKKIFYMSIIYVYVCNHEMDNPI